MIGYSALLSRLRVQPWAIAITLLLAACQTSKNAPWLQGDRAPGADATGSAAVKAEQKPRPKEKTNPEPRFLFAGPYPFPTSITPPPVPATKTAPETAAAPPNRDSPGDSRGTATDTAPPLSFKPFLNRPPSEARDQTVPGLRSSVPMPASGDTVRVALLVPLSGTNARLGQAMLNAAQLAVFAFADKKFELLVRDTKGTATGAVQAATVAVGDGASMILGPLLSASVRAVGPAARAANVPVVSFSSDRSIAGNGTYTMGFLPSAEINRIVAFARSKGILRYAALAPDTVYGETVVRALEAAVARAGGSVAKIQFYDPQADDFAPAVKALAEYDIRRQALLGQRKELEDKEDEISKRAHKRLERLQTIGKLPFDALLVADGGKRLQSIAALLPFYDIDPKKVRMMGTGQWDDKDIGAEPALLGGWFAAPSPVARSDFENAYKATFGKSPPRLATLAYDAAALAAVLARGKNGADFSAAAITVPSGFWGRDGIFRFLPEGVAERGLAVMKVTRKGPEIISRAPDTFQAAQKTYN
ncbi:MAG: penicillin-binding protein activator [Proteobacteria bacterium]|nr:penicillin-binding protein activator [Pseudomonadota bacterium]